MSVTVILTDMEGNITFATWDGVPPLPGEVVVCRVRGKEAAEPGTWRVVVLFRMWNQVVTANLPNKLPTVQVECVCTCRPLADKETPGAEPTPTK